MNPMPAAHSRTQSGRGRRRERPGSRTSPVAMAKGAAQPRLLKLTLRGNAAPCTQMPEFSEMRKCHPPMCPGEGGEKSTKLLEQPERPPPSARSNFQLYQQLASNLTQPQAYLTTPEGQGWVHPGVHLPPTTTSARPQGFCGTSPHGSRLSQTQVLSSLTVTPHFQRQTWLLSPPCGSLGVVRKPVVLREGPVMGHLLWAQRSRCQADCLKWQGTQGSALSLEPLEGRCGGEGSLLSSSRSHVVTRTLEPEQQGGGPRLTQVDPECPQQLTQGLPQTSAAGCYWHRAREQPVCRNFTSRIVFKPGD